MHTQNYGIIVPTSVTTVPTKEISKLEKAIKSYDSHRCGGYVEKVVHKALNIYQIQNLLLPQGSVGDVVKKWDMLVEYKDAYTPVQIKSSRKAAEQFHKQYPKCIVVWFNPACSVGGHELGAFLRDVIRPKTVKKRSSGMYSNTPAPKADWVNPLYK